MFDVPDASVPAVEMCWEGDLVGDVQTGELKRAVRLQPRVRGLEPEPFGAMEDACVYACTSAPTSPGARDEVLERAAELACRVPRTGT